jgi:Uma2 family endonuclease
MNAPLRLPIIPPLENGDHLTRDEFERRYHAMPNLKKAELIDGVVYMPSPVRADQHGKPHAAVLGWLVNYWANTPIVAAADNSTIRLDLENEPQPDAVLYLEPAHGGQARIDADGYIAGGPELVAEVSASSVSLDLNSKFRLYLRNGVREYVVWRVLDQAIDWFALRQDQYVQVPLTNGLYQSEVFPGLWLDRDALMRFDLMRVIQAVQVGCASPEHAGFLSAHPPGP